MRDDGSSKSDSKKRGVEVVDDIVMMQQNSSVATLLAGKRKCGVDPKDMQVVQCLWVWCSPCHLCPIHGPVFYV
jgi:hypothetical protein